MPPFVLSLMSLDLGTSSVKGLLLEGLDIRAQSVRAYSLKQPQPGRAEQDPREIFAATAEVMEELLSQGPAPLAAAVFSAPMHSLMAVDADGCPLTPLVTWADSRAAGIARDLRDAGDALALYRRTGAPVHAMLPVLKLRWFRQHRPDVWRQARRWCGIKEYVVYRLTGRWAVDVSVAAATGLLNLFTLTWDGGALDWAGVTADLLPDVTPATTVIGSVPSGRLAHQTAELPVVIGSSDGVLANLGVGAIQPGVCAVSIGTSGAVRQVAATPLLDAQGRLFCYPLDAASYVVGGPVNNGGIVYRWLRDLLGLPEVARASQEGTDPYDLLNPLVAATPRGAEGLVCLPYLTGERAPLWDEELVGALVGLSLAHGRGHILRAALEGVCYQLRSVHESLEALAGPTREIRATGGFTRSETWRQILADVLGADVRVPLAEGSAFGAAIVAWKALGQMERWEECLPHIAIAAENRVSADGRAFYEDGYRVFLETLRDMLPLLHRVRRLRP